MPAIGGQDPQEEIQERQDGECGSRNADQSLIQLGYVEILYNQDDADDSPQEGRGEPASGGFICHR